MVWLTFCAQSPMTETAPAPLPRWITKRKLLIAATAVCAIITGLAFFSLWSQAKSLEKSALERVELYARILEDQINRTFNAANASMAAIAETTATQQETQTPTSNSLLQKSIQQTPFLRSVSLVSSTGVVLASSNSDNINVRIDFRNLGLATDAQTESASPAFNGQTQLGQTSPGRDLAEFASNTTTSQSRFSYLPYARRITITTDKKSELGWLIATMNPDFFSNQHELLLDSAQRSTALLQMNGHWISTSNATTEAAVIPPNQHIFFKKYLPAKESGSLIGPGLFGSKVVSAFRTARNQPVVVIVEESYAFATQAFQDTLQRTLAIVMLLIVLIVALARGAITSLRQHERAAQLEQERMHTLQAMQELQAKQTQRVQAEKIASLSLLVANVAHEINTPIGAVKSSGAMIADSLTEALTGLMQLIERLSASERDLFKQLISGTQGDAIPLSTRDERVLSRHITQQLEAAGVASTPTMARLLIQLRMHDQALAYLPLFLHPESALIVSVAFNIATMVNSSGNINRSVERVSRIIFALKEFSAADGESEKMPVELPHSIDSALQHFKSQIQATVQVVRDYGAMPPLPCVPEAIRQVWTHMIHNAVLAMHDHGTLTLRLQQQDGYAVVSVIDTGCGISEDHVPQIFDAFFTTRTAGEGSGLGLAVVKKIIDKHQGRISVHSTVGAGTTMTVYIPYPTP